METSMAATPSASSSSKKKGKKRGRQSQIFNINEAARSKIIRAIDEFQTGQDTVFTFEANLTNQERAVVHELCRKFGMTSRSSGRGKERHVSVFKPDKALWAINKTRRKETLDSFTFSEDAKVVLQDLFTLYPPADHEVSEQMVVDSGKTGKTQRRGDDMFCIPLMSKVEIAKNVAAFVSRVEKTPSLRQIAEERSKLPIASFRDVITSTIESHQVLLISGETGCGKTTQVPQFLLDHMWGKGEPCKIVCTQPRRISAISVSERISSERGENIGESVGYKIRLEKKGGRHSSIVFCTNGILLRVLVSQGGGSLTTDASRKMQQNDILDITHIVVDEIHERDRFSDFMLAIIRDMLPSYPHLRLVLMSATLDAERFSQYFGGCPIIRVPGFTYPVQVFYLEDVLALLKSTKTNNLDSTEESSTIEDCELTEEYKLAFDEAINLALSNDEFDSLLDMVSSEGGPEVLNFQHSLTGVTPLMVFAGKGRLGDLCMLLSLGANCHLRAYNGATALEWAERENQREAVEIINRHMEKAFSISEKEQNILDNYLSTANPELIDVVLIEQLLRKICIESKDGAMLVFLPGWDDINRTRERLEASPFFSDPSKFLILCLHSLVPSVEQKKVFQRPPSGCRKIVLSTNIAETSVTINDVIYVIDSGRMKQKSYDPYDNVSTIHSSWVSKASARQREGRAGRCQPGICYHLYSKIRAASLLEFQIPEIKRMPIEELCLQVKLLDQDCNIEDFLQKTLDPPVYETIRNAIVVLQDIGALTMEEKLTVLGKRIGSLPVHPLAGKMLIFAILMNCVSPALTLACASDCQNLFTFPMLFALKKRADAAKSKFSSLYGGCSDQLAAVAAFECWKSAQDRGHTALFCSKYFVSYSAMKMLSSLRNQLLSELIRNGFIPEGAYCDINAHDPGVLRAVVACGLYPMVGRLLPAKKSKRSIVETSGGSKVRLHPQSTNSTLSCDIKKRPMVVYDEIVRGDGGMSIRQCSVIGPLPLLLLAMDIVVAPATNEDDGETKDNESDYEDANDEVISDEDRTQMRVSLSERRGEKIMSLPDNTVKLFVDRWLPFESTALDVAQIYCLRERLSAAFMFKVNNPRRALPDILAASVNAISCILSSDGTIMPLKAMDSMTSKVGATEIDQTRWVSTNAENSDPFLSSLLQQQICQNFDHHHGAEAPAPMGLPDGNNQANDYDWNNPANNYAHPHGNTPTNSDEKKSQRARFLLYCKRACGENSNSHHEDGVPAPTGLAHGINPPNNYGQPDLDNPANNSGQPHLDNAANNQGQPHLDNPANNYGPPHLDNAANNQGQPHLDNPANNYGQPHLDNPAKNSGQPHLDNPTSNYGQPHLDSPANNFERPHLDNPENNFGRLHLDNPAKNYERPHLDIPTNNYRRPHLDIPANYYGQLHLDNPANNYGRTHLDNPASNYERLHFPPRGSLSYLMPPIVQCPPIVNGYMIGVNPYLRPIVPLQVLPPVGSFMLGGYHRPSERRLDSFKRQRGNRY